MICRMHKALIWDGGLRHIIVRPFHVCIYKLGLLLDVVCGHIETHVDECVCVCVDLYCVRVHLCMLTDAQLSRYAASLQG